jgi:hypothetical protein
VKGYFYLLSILFASSVLFGGLRSVLIADMETRLLYLAGVALFSLCLAGCYGLAFNRSYLSPQAWKLVGHMTLALGAVTVILGLRGPEPAELFSLFMALLNHALFAVPAILYGHHLQNRLNAGG